MDLIQDKSQKTTTSKMLDDSIGKSGFSVTPTLTNEKEKNRPTKALKILLMNFLDSDNEVKGTRLKQLTPCPSWQPLTQTQQPSCLTQKKID